MKLNYNQTKKTIQLALRCYMETIESTLRNEYRNEVSREDFDKSLGGWVSLIDDDESDTAPLMIGTFKDSEDGGEFTSVIPDSKCRELSNAYLAIMDFSSIIDHAENYHAIIKTAEIVANIFKKKDKDGQ